MVDSNTTKHFLDGSNVIADYDGSDMRLATYLPRLLPRTGRA